MNIIAALVCVVLIEMIYRVLKKLNIKFREVETPFERVDYFLVFLLFALHVMILLAEVCFEMNYYVRSFMVCAPLILMLVVLNLRKQPFTSVGLNLRTLPQVLLFMLILEFALYAINGLQGHFLNTYPTLFQFAKSAVLISLVAINEELFYRGFIQTRLTSINWLFGICVAALFFGMSHIPRYWILEGMGGYTLFHTIFGIFLNGFVNGYLYWRTKNIIAPFLSHFLGGLLGV